MVKSCDNLSLFQALVTSCSNVLVSKNNGSERIFNKKQRAWEYGLSSSSWFMISKMIIIVIMITWSLFWSPAGIGRLATANLPLASVHSMSMLLEREGRKGQGSFNSTWMILVMATLAMGTKKMRLKSPLFSAWPPPPTSRPPCPGQSAKSLLHWSTRLSLPGKQIFLPSQFFLPGQIWSNNDQFWCLFTCFSKAF